jgi:hypothetical protein
MENELEKRVMEFPVRAVEIQVTDQQTLTAANDFLLAAKGLQKEVNATFDPLIKAANDSHVAALAAKNKFIIPLDKAEKAVKTKITAYLCEQDRLRREAEAKARQAEWERQRAEAEKKRLEEEAMRKALEAEAKGETKEAEQIIEQAARVEQEIPIVPVVPFVIPEQPKVEGLSMREDWDFEIVDVKAIPREYLVPNEVMIRKVVKVMKSQANIPGIRVFSKQILSARG